MENTTEKTINTYYHDKLGVGLYHLDPRWCSTYDFKRVSGYGMVNAYRLTTEAGSTSFIRGCRYAMETGAQVWYSAPTFISAKETIEEFMARLDKTINGLKKHGVWDAVVGFQWDEPLLKKGHTNEDFLVMTKAISEAYGMRIFPVFSMYEIVGKRGNIGDPDFQWLLKKESSKYITDVAFDVYSYDFRGELRDATKERLKRHYNIDFTTAEEALQFYTDKMLELMENPDDVRVWYFPCAYLCRLWEGGPLADEDFCIQSLEGYKNLLLKQKNPGGLFSYGFKSWGEHNHLDWWVDEDNPDMWKRYVEAAKNVCDEIKDIKIKL